MFYFIYLFKYLFSDLHVQFDGHPFSRQQRNNTSIIHFYSPVCRSSCHRFYEQKRPFLVIRDEWFFPGFASIWQAFSECPWNNIGWQVGTFLVLAGRKMQNDTHAESQERKQRLTRPVTANYSHISFLLLSRQGRFKHKSFQQRDTGV